MESSGRERRLQPRFSASLSCSVALTEGERDILFPNEKLECRTRDVSESGIGLAASSIYLGYTCIVDEGRALNVRLELPDGAVEMEATAAHYLRHDEGGADATYLIGLRITAMTDEHRALYAAYLDTLSQV
ncbi:MAG TPA: PilZ domain-containing protein [Pyrinomonadaceae bacterium]|nr:PilZ domain-containing protein [Pyrinomonadaceae bacterium]